MKFHTPGKWTVAADLEQNVLFVYSEDNQVVCRLNKVVDTDKPLTIEDAANAELIASAPELLKAIKRKNELINILLGTFALTICFLMVAL